MCVCPTCGETEELAPLGEGECSTTFLCDDGRLDPHIEDSWFPDSDDYKAE